MPLKHADGIAEDTWRDWDRPGQGYSTREGTRPFNSAEIRAILYSGIGCD